MEAVWSDVYATEEMIGQFRDQRFLRLRNLVAVELLFATGMRVGELVTLKTTDWPGTEASFVVRGKGARQRLALLPDAGSIKAVKMYVHQRSALNVDHSGLLVNATGGN